MMADRHQIFKVQYHLIHIAPERPSLKMAPTTPAEACPQPGSGGMCTASARGEADRFAYMRAESFCAR